MKPMSFPDWMSLLANTIAVITAVCGAIKVFIKLNTPPNGEIVMVAETCVKKNGYPGTKINR